MSLYNLLFGTNPNRAVVLGLLGLRDIDVERFRDCAIDFDSKEITIYTRTGGGNREDYPNQALVSHPCYIDDADDEFDSTYATYRFSWPEALANDIPSLSDPQTHGIPGAIIRVVTDVLGKQDAAAEAQRLRAKHAALEKELLSGSYGVHAIHMNGHTLMPLSTRAIGRIFSAYETDGAWHGSVVQFCQIETRTQHVEAVGTPGETWATVALRPLGDWPHDPWLWARARKLYADKYPKAVAYWQAEVDVQNERRAKRSGSVGGAA